MGVKKYDSFTSKIKCPESLNFSRQLNQQKFHMSMVNVLSVYFSTDWVNNIEKTYRHFYHGFRSCTYTIGFYNVDAVLNEYPPNFDIEKGEVRQ